MTRIVFAVSLAVLLLGCSRVQFFYHQLDWLVPFYLESYVELDEHQRSYLDSQVEALLQWHCSVHLDGYAKLLRQANDDFQAGRMDGARLLEYGTRLERYWLELMAESVPAIAHLLATATDEQIAELFDSFEESIQESRESFEGRSMEEIREEYVERMTDELQRWFGPLAPRQAEAVAAWSGHFVPLGEEAIKNRRIWQGRLRELLAQREDLPTLRAGLQQLLLDAQSQRTEEYRARLDHNRDVTVALIERVGASLTDEQRSHLSVRVGSYARDFEALSCKEEFEEQSEQAIAS